MGQTVNLLAYAYGGSNPSLPTHSAEIAQLVEHNLAKVGVASSSLVFRSTKDDHTKVILFFVLYRIAYA